MPSHIQKCDDPNVAASLTPGGVRLWNSPRGQVLVADTHPKQKRLLASMFVDWATLINLRKEISRQLRAGLNPYEVTMEGQGVVESPLSKLETRTEKRIRDAENKLGLTIKDLAERPETDVDSDEEYE